MAARKGAAHHFAKLDNAKVAQMRAQYLAGGVSYLDLSVEYGIEYNTCREAVTGRTWKEAPFPAVRACGHCQGSGRSV